MNAIYERDDRFQAARLRFFAPNFRCSGGSVEIPDGWESRYCWDQEDSTKNAIASLIADHGIRSRVFEGRGIEPNGYRVPIAAWDAAMNVIVGVQWDLSRISNEEAMVLLREAH
jgi:hypothetical protein